MLLRTLTLGILCIGASLSAQEQPSSVRLADICRIKGQEENRLQGLGLVVGLKGTGDNKLSVKTRTLARLVQNMGGAIATDQQGVPNLKELEEAANVALVMVTATIPAAGAQQGDQLNCTVDAINAKSLAGGRLALAYMLGPRADDRKIYGIASGQISIPDVAVPTSAVVYNGCKMESTVKNGFVYNDKVTLILDRDLASFSTAADVQDAINSFFNGTMTGGNYGLANALDQLHVEVDVPSAYVDKPVMFVKLLLNIELSNIKKRKRVVINQREGVIAIDGDVMINPVAISHKNLTIQAGGSVDRFVAFDPESPKNPQPTLKNLVEALNALKVNTDDIAAIIRTLKRNGDLYGEVIVQ